MLNTKDATDGKIILGIIKQLASHDAVIDRQNQPIGWVPLDFEGNLKDENGKPYKWLDKNAKKQAKKTYPSYEPGPHFMEDSTRLGVHPNVFISMDDDVRDQIKKDEESKTEKLTIYNAKIIWEKLPREFDPKTGDFRTRFKNKFQRDK